MAAISTEQNIIQMQSESSEVTHPFQPVIITTPLQLTQTPQILMPDSVCPSGATEVVGLRNRLAGGDSYRYGSTGEAWMGGRASPLIALGEPVGLVRRLQPYPSGSDGSAELYNPALFAASSAAMVLGQPGTTSGTNIRVSSAPGVDSCGAPAIDCHSLGLRNKVVSELRKAKTNYFSKLIEEANVPLSKAPYSPNICSPGAVHGRSLLCVLHQMG
ncbi:unnamed protein product [Pleuronectes platessa]|uniref:Uncharacterized protein n=1 Tax=Pleuronectes platessa TaxID=8262 RepID=A0A9N7VD44_PLEPL|nr:unnamed protein product [Pleuronectes platessa]